MKMRKYKRIIYIICSVLVGCLLYSNLAWALPGVKRETLAPQSPFQGVRRGSNKAASGVKFIGLPLTREQAEDILSNSRMETIDREEIRELKGSLIEFIERVKGERGRPEIDLPHDLQSSIRMKLIGLMDVVNESVRTNERVKNQQGKLIEQVLNALGSMIGKNMFWKIDVEHILESFEELERRGGFRLFRPTKRRYLEYFMDSTAIFTEDGGCYFLRPMWRRLDLIQDKNQSKKLKFTLLMHELVERCLCQSGTHPLVAHYIAEIVERYILGEELTLEGESLLDREIKQFLGRGQSSMSSEPSEGERNEIKELFRKLNEFSDTVDKARLEREKERFKQEEKQKELYRQFTREAVKQELGISESETFFIWLFEALFVDDPDEARPIRGFPGDQYDFAALLNLYIEEKLTHGFLRIDPAIMNEQGSIGEREEATINIPEYDFEDDGFWDIHLHFLTGKVADLFVGEASRRTGQELDKERLVSAIGSVVSNMQKKAPDLVKGMFSDLSEHGRLKIVFQPVSPDTEYLFRYNKLSGELEICMDVLAAIGNPEIIEILIATGLFGNLLLGYSGDMIENTAGLLEQYEVTPANFVYNLSKITALGERYPECIAEHMHSPKSSVSCHVYSVFKFGDILVRNMTRRIRAARYPPSGNITFNIPSGIIIESEYNMLARAISEEILTLYIPQDIRIRFVDEFAEGLTYALIYSVYRARGAERDMRGWAIQWEITDERVDFRIEYPVGGKELDLDRELDRKISTGLWKFDGVSIEPVPDQTAKETLKLVQNLPVRPILFEAIGKRISPTEVPDSALIPVPQEEVEDAIASLERRFKIIQNKPEFDRGLIKLIGDYIKEIKRLASEGRIFRFEAIVRESEKFLLGFADKRGIALCREFFQKGHNLHTVLDEALFHEVYHLLHIDFPFSRNNHSYARMLQEIFFVDHLHYEIIIEPHYQKRSKLGKHARRLILQRLKDKERQGEIILLTPKMRIHPLTEKVGGEYQIVSGLELGTSL